MSAAAADVARAHAKFAPGTRPVTDPRERADALLIANRVIAGAIPGALDLFDDHPKFRWLILTVADANRPGKAVTIEIATMGWDPIAPSLQRITENAEAVNSLAVDVQAMTFDLGELGCTLASSRRAQALLDQMYRALCRINGHAAALHKTVAPRHWRPIEGHHVLDVLVHARRASPEELARWARQE